MLWQISKVISAATALVTHTFLAFFIWETQGKLGTILIYGLFFFIAIPLAALVAGLISDKLDPKISLLLGTWFQVIQLLFLLLYRENLSLEVIAFIAVIGGIGEGLSIVATQTIDHHKLYKKDTAKFYATRSLIVAMLQLVIPLGAAYLISTTGSYVQLFRFTTIILVFNAAILLFIKHEHTPNPFDLKSIMTFPGTNHDKKHLVQAVFFEGISEGVILILLPIIILNFVGSILNWGFLNTAFVLVSIIFAYLLKRFMNDVNSKVVYAIGAILFASVSIFFITQFSFFVVMIFLLAMNIMEVIKSSSYQSSLEKIIEQDVKEYQLYTEYQFLIELARAVGRLLPVILLIYVSINIADELILRLVLLATGLLPLITLSMLGKSAVFEETYEKEHTISSIREEITATPNLNKKNKTPTLSDNLPG